MFKLITLVLGMGIGFGGGVWWGVHHPNEAANLSAQEEQEVLEQTQAMKDKIAKLMAKHPVSGISLPAGVPGSGLLGGNASAGGAVDPDLQELDQKAQKQIDMLKAKLHK